MNRRNLIRAWRDVTGLVKGRCLQRNEFSLLFIFILIISPLYFYLYYCNFLPPPPNPNSRPFFIFCLAISIFPFFFPICLFFLGLSNNELADGIPGRVFHLPFVLAEITQTSNLRSEMSY